jgi:hypothetical protein
VVTAEMFKGQKGVHVRDCIHNLNYFQKQKLENDSRSYSSLYLLESLTEFLFCPGNGPVRAVLKTVM